MNDDTTPDTPPPPSIDDMKAAIKANHYKLVKHLGEMRAERTRLNTSIAGCVAELKEAERLVKALEPRKRGKT